MNRRFLLWCLLALAALTFLYFGMAVAGINLFDKALRLPAGLTNSLQAAVEWLKLEVQRFVPGLLK